MRYAALGERREDTKGMANEMWRTEVNAKLTAGKLESACAVIEAWLASHRDDVEARRQLARILLHLHQPAEGLRHLRAAAALAPNVEGLHYEMGVLALAAERLEDAEAAFRFEILAHPDNADALFNLGWTLRGLKRHADSVEALWKSAVLRPDSSVTWFNLGNALMACGRAEDAVVAYQQAARLAPQDFDILTNFAHALWRVGNDGAAETLFRTILAAKPRTSYAAEGLGQLLTTGGRANEAVAVYAAALRAEPNQPPLLRGLGLALLAQDRFHKALRPLQAAVQCAPDDPEMWNSLGMALLADDQLDAAAPAFEQALTLQPAHVEALNNLGNLAARRNDAAAAEHYFRQALALAPGHAAVHSNLLFLLTHKMADANRADVVEEHRRYGECQEARIPALPPRPRRDPAEPDQRLRIGYVSPDFRDHAVTLWFEPILALHDHKRFKIYCYYTGQGYDEVTRRLKAYADEWRSVGQLDPDKAARLVQTDGIDVLVDLAGHSANNGLPIFTRKPAPVQATFLGYPATTGLSRIDYRISDICSSPPGDERFYTERIERLTRPPVFRPPFDAPKPGPLPSLSSGRVRFGSFNRPEKIDQAVWDTWYRLLRESPSAGFTMVLPGGNTAAVRETYLARFAANGITADRIEIHGLRPLNEFLRLVASVDIALDPFPYGGGTTTLLTLWMGVPLVAMTGEQSSFGVAAGTLGSVLAEDFLATDADSYVAVAKQMAASPSRLVELRSSLRDRMRSSIMMEEGAFVRELEGAYERWCRTP